MTARYDAVVIGGGVNGLTAAACLARAGRRTLLLERSEELGGQSQSAEFAPGFSSSPLGADAGWLPPPVARALGIQRPELVTPEATLSVPVAEREWLVLSKDIERSTEVIRRYSPGDAAKWRRFCSQLAKHAGLLSALYVLPAPDVDTSDLSEVLPLLGVARQLWGMGRRDMVEFLRTMPMSVQELLDDWFEGGALKAGIGAQGVRDLRQGPRSGGTTFRLLHGLVGAPPGSVGGNGYWKTGPDAFVEALGQAARGARVEVRAGAEVVRILAKDDRATGVVLAGGEEIQAHSVLSSADPARTLLGLVDPVWLDPELLLAVQNIKFRGCSARVSYALDRLPDFGGLANAQSVLSGSLSLTGSLDELERAADAAKYGNISERPFVSVQVQSVRWPQLAPVGKHVLVADVQWVPYALRYGSWDAPRRSMVSDRVTAAIAERAPGFAASILHQELLTPPDLERRYGLTQGAVTQGEMTLDQILFMRPVPGASRYATPLEGLYLCGSGSHPGPGIPGAPGWLAVKRVLADRSRA